LHAVVQDTIEHDYRKLPLVLTGISSTIAPRSIPLEIERIVIPHMAHRKKYLAMCVQPTSIPIHCELAASMVARGLDFTYNSADQRQIDDFGDHTGRCLTLWTEAICSATVEEQTLAWGMLSRCLTNIGFLADPLPVENSPIVYLVAFAICLLQTTYNTQDENALVRKALRCLRSNPGIDFSILHPTAVSEFTCRLLEEPQWKTDCPHFIRWFLAHALRIGAVDSQTDSIAIWISELEAIMPEVEELDIDTKEAYAKLGYVWDTTFDSWIKQTPAKSGPSLSRRARCQSPVDMSSSPAPEMHSEDSGFYSQDRSSPSMYRSSSPPTPVAAYHSIVTATPAAPVVKLHTFSSPFMNSPVVKSSITPKNIIKNRLIQLKQPVSSATLVTPLHPTKKIMPSTSESLDPLDDIEELDKTTPSLPRRVIVDADSTMSDDSTLEQDENDPLAVGFSDAPLDSPLTAYEATPRPAHAMKRKATVVSSPLRPDWSKRPHLR
jgi:hypothetical protein